MLCDPSECRRFSCRRLITKRGYIISATKEWGLPSVYVASTVLDLQLQFSPQISIAKQDSG